MNKLEIISITKTNFKQDAILWLRLIILCQLIFLGDSNFKFSSNLTVT